MAVEIADEDAEAARQLRRLLDSLPAQVSFWDPDLRCALANQAYRDWFGLSEQQIQGMHMREVLGPERFDEDSHLAELALKGEELYVERTVLDDDGRLRRRSGRYIPYRDNGTVNGIFTVVEDHTSEGEMRQQLDKAQALARIGSFVYYPVSGEISWSTEMFHLIGADSETDVPSLHLWEERVHPEDRVEVRATLEDAFTAGRPFALHARLLLPDGTVRFVQCLGEPTRDARGVFVRMSGTVQDETEIRTINEELRRSNARLENANQLLSDTVAMLGHDVRQPLQAITSFLELTEDAWVQLTDQQRLDNVRRALDSGLRMRVLVDNILTLMNVESGSLVLRPEQVLLEQEVVTAIREVADLGVETDVEPGLAAWVDRFHLRQSLANLLSNAARYGAPPLQVTARTLDGVPTIEVADRGEGVPAEFVPHLFDRFARAGTGAAVGTPGSGFGLYLARKLVEANGGTLTYSRNHPTGARFRITLTGLPDEGPPV